VVLTSFPGLLTRHGRPWDTGLGIQDPDVVGSRSPCGVRKFDPAANRAIQRLAPTSFFLDTPRHALTLDGCMVSADARPGVRSNVGPVSRTPLRRRRRLALDERLIPLRASACSARAYYPVPGGGALRRRHRDAMRARALSTPDEPTWRLLFQRVTRTRASTNGGR
jgi:hypothetical protein